MTLIDGDRIVTAQLYDDEHEEFTEKKMSIIDFVNKFADEGVTTADDVLDKIRAEIKEKIEQEEFARSVFRHEEKDAAKAEQCTGSIMAYNNVIKLIDKYKAESEPQESEDKKC